MHTEPTVDVRITTSVERPRVTDIGGAGVTQDPRRLDLKLLRLAVHGWWLGNPLVYKPDTNDIIAVARELAAAGARSGTLVLSEARGDGDTSGDQDTASADMMRMALILRPVVPRAQAGLAAARAVAELAGETFGCSSAIQHSWEVVDERGPSRTHLCQVEVEQHEQATLLGLLLALEHFWPICQGDTDDQPNATLIARPDRREVVLARVLHALDTRLQAVRAL